MSVFVLDKRCKPLMPCNEKRACPLLERKRARVHRVIPFVIRLVDRTAEACSFQPVRVKLDLGSKTTGIAVVREEGKDQFVGGWEVPALVAKAMGRGTRQRTILDKYGFPRGYCMRTKFVKGFQTGDLAKAVVPKGKHTGVHCGRVAVRATGSFNIGAIQGIHARYCAVVQRNDGYQFNRTDSHYRKEKREEGRAMRDALSLPALKGRVSRAF